MKYKWTETIHLWIHCSLCMVCKNAYFKKKVIKVILLFCFAGLRDSLSNKWFNLSGLQKQKPLTRTGD